MKIFRSAFFAPLLILAAALLCSAVLLNVRTKEYAGWQPAEAVISERIQLRGLKDRIYYTFAADEKQLAGSDVIHRHIHTPPEGSVATVWYDADDPSRTSYSRPSAQFDSWAPFFLAVPLSFGLLAINLRRERNTVS